MALLAHVYGLSLSDLGRQTSTQYRIMAENMAEVWAHWHLQVAQLEATILNLFGGKPEPGQESKALPQERMYTADERLVPFARFTAGETWTPAALRDAHVNSKNVPSWARTLIPWEKAAKAGRGNP